MTCQVCSALSRVTVLVLVLFALLLTGQRRPVYAAPGGSPTNAGPPGRAAPLEPWQTGWVATGALSRVPVFAPEPAPPAAPSLLGVHAATNYRGDPIVVPAWSTPPPGSSYRLYRSSDGENWTLVDDEDTRATGGAAVPFVQDTPPGRITLYRLTASQAGVESSPGPMVMAERGSLLSAQGVTGSLGTSSANLSAPCALFLECQPTPGLKPGVYNLLQVGNNYTLLNLQVSPDGSYSIYCIAWIVDAKGHGSYHFVGESRHHTGRTAYLVVIDGASSHIVADGIDDPQSHGDLTGLSETGPISVSSCSSIGLFRLLSYVPTAAESGVLFAYASYLSQTPYTVGERAIVAGSEHTIAARLRPDPDPPINFGAVKSELNVTPDGSPTGDGSLARPLDLASALTRTVVPGTTIWLHSGWYRSVARNPGGVNGPLYPGDHPWPGGWTVTLQGQPGEYCQVRPYPGDTVVLDGPLNVRAPAQYVVLRDLYSTISEARHPARDNANTTGRPGWAGYNLLGGSHIVLLDDVVAECSQGIEDWVGNQNSLVYGCVLSDNGWDDPVLGPRGHNIYVQNTTGAKQYHRDISVRPYDLALHAYGHGPISGLDVEDCVFAGGNVLLGSQSGGDNQNIFSGNAVFDSPVELGYQGHDNVSLTADANILTGPRAGLDTTHYQHVSGANTIDSSRSGDAILWANAYDPNRWNLGVWGYGSRGTEEVTLDLSAVLRVGDHYELRQAGGYDSEPPTDGIYRGPVRVMLGGMHGAAGVAGQGQEPPSCHFDAFVLRKL